MFVVSIGRVVGKVFYSRSKRHHIEVIELYKSQILILECELEHYKQETAQYKEMLFTHIGLVNSRAEQSNSEQRPVHKAMSPLRMRQSLEQFSRQAASNKK